MALIIYPSTGFDSFISASDTDDFLSKNIPSSQRTDWDSLTDVADKEIYLRQATNIIKNKIDLPSENDVELQQATAYLANYSINKDLLNSDTSSNVKKIVLDDGTIEKEYFSPNKSENELPDIVVELLSKYDVESSGSFNLARA